MAKPSRILDKVGTKNKEQLFPAICLVVSGGHTQLILMKNFGKYRKSGSQPQQEKILYICEPISRKLKVAFGSRFIEYHDEIHILKEFFECMTKFNTKIDLITLRLHPSENLNKYQAIIREYQNMYNRRRSSTRNRCS